MTNNNSETGMPKAESEQEFTGKLTFLNYFKRPQGLTANIGSKYETFADVNIDIKRNPSLQVIASALNMPFVEGTFEAVYFNEVLEHLPAGSEQKAINEIQYVLKKDGALFLSTPCSGVWKFVDPAYYTFSHRHYTVNKVCQLLEKADLTIKTTFTGGGIWEAANNILYCFLLWPIRKIAGLEGHLLSSMPYVYDKAGREFHLAKSKGGYVIFVYAIKKGG
jgi:SAM-dependent methyltransferase